MFHVDIRNDKESNLGYSRSAVTFMKDKVLRTILIQACEVKAP